MIKKIILHRVSLTDKAFQEIHLNFIDIIYDILDPSTFVRIINDNQFVYEKGKRVLSQKRKKVKYFTTLKKCNTFTNNFITMDLETKYIDGNLIPYCVSIFDGSEATSFYITEFK